MQVLIVDDSMLQRMKLKQFLVGQGFETLEAENGRVALEKLQDAAPSIIITDLLMPEMDGFGLLEELKKLESSPPAIVLSADIQDTSVARCKELGAVDFINKPLQGDAVLEAIKAHTAN